MTASSSIDHNLPLTLCLNQSLDLPLPGGVVKPGALTWHAESKDPEVARVTLTSVTPSGESPDAAHPTVVWHLHIKGQKPGKTTIKVRETAESHPPQIRYEFTLEVNVRAQKQVSSAVLLSAGERVNQLQIGGDLGWFQTESNASVGTSWSYKPDNSGVYELADQVGLHHATPLMPGQGSSTCWQFRGVRPGQGTIMFERHFRGEIAETVKLLIKVVK